jgi:ArsR family transcriptional regulator, virulence genes transcriptional regulator
MSKRPAAVVRRKRLSLRSMQTHAQDAADFLKALANEQRLMILCNLLQGPLTVSALNERLALSQSALSQHLAVLRESNIVTTSREAQTIYYSLPAGAATRIIELLYEKFCRTR